MSLPGPGVRLIVTEAGKDSVLAGEVVVHADVEFAFVETPHRRVGEVEARIKGNAVHCSPDKDGSAVCQHCRKKRMEPYCTGYRRLRPIDWSGTMGVPVPSHSNGMPHWAQSHCKD